MGDVGDEHRFPLALVKEAGEVGLAKQARELVVGAEIGGGEGGEGGGVERRRIAGPYQ